MDNIYDVPKRHISIFLKWLRREYRKFQKTIEDENHIYCWGNKSGYIIHLNNIYNRYFQLEDNKGKKIDEKPNRFILLTKSRRKSIFVLIQNESRVLTVNSAPYHWTRCKMKELNVTL